MSFVLVEWHHDFDREPVEIYSQLNENRFEIRKIEVFRDGTGQVAGPGLQQGDTFLADVPFPEPEVISQEEGFNAAAISAERFWNTWRKHAPTLAE